MKKLIISILFAVISMSIAAQTYSVSYSPASHNPVLMTLTIKSSSYSMDNVIIDSGSTTTQLSYSDYIHLKQLGLLSQANYLGLVKTRSCNGSITSKPKYRLASVQIGTFKLNNVDVIFDTVNKDNNIRLLGLNILNVFSSMTVDFRSHVINFTV